MKKQRVKLKLTPRVREYNMASQKGSEARHVIKHHNGWAIKKRSAKRASKIYLDKAEAVKKARLISSSENSAVVIHNKNGTISNILSPR